MTTTKPEKTIAHVFEEFLTDQKDRISHKTFLKYQSIIGLYKSYLESYWPGHDGEYDKITKAGGTFCGTFGPEDGHEEAGEVAGREGLHRGHRGCPVQQPRRMIRATLRKPGRSRARQR